MKVISLHQPWATLIAIGAKRIETRSWNTSYRGPLAIHASKEIPKYAREFAMYDEECRAALDAAGYTHYSMLPKGAIVAVCNLAQVLPTFKVRELPADWWNPSEKHFGNYEAGRHGFLLVDVQRLIDPIPARGSLGLWDWQPGPDWERALGIWTKGA
jgi:activating signal cointegrator 1